MMQKRYYLSEMAVSNKHGGGLTLQRILQDDLKQFDNFFHLHEFASRECPIIDELQARQLNLHELAETKPDSLRYYFERVINKLRIQRCFESRLDKCIRKSAEYILRNFDLTHSSWLVIPQDILSIRVLNRIFRHSPVDYITWMMDDHVIQWNNGWHYPEGFEDEMAFHLQNARKVFVISPVMARLYRNRFGVNSDILFGPADPIAAPVYQSPKPSGPVRLCYFGAIRRWQRDALEGLARYLPSLDATLEIFTFQEPPASLRGNCVCVRPPIPAQEVMLRMREYDGVVIAASFEERNRSLTELNIATKMSECLASGTVPVIIGPEYAAMAQFVREYGGALVVSDLGDPIQRTRIKSLKENSFREWILNQARNTAEGVCSVRAMRGAWQKCWHQERVLPHEAERSSTRVHGWNPRTDEPSASSGS